MLTLQAEKRDIFGKKLRRPRAEGRLPAVMYGPKEAPQALFVGVKDFQKIIQLAGETAVVNIKIGGEEKDVMVHDVARHPVSGKPLHADFYVIDKTKKVEVDVPLKFAGTAPAVKELGGTLVKVLHELKIEALPFDVPRELIVDIAPLATLESQLLVKDIKVPAGVAILNQSDEVVAAVSEVKEEVEEAPPPDLSTIEVEKKGKKEPSSAEATEGEGGGTGASQEEK